jgi:hypothetical protein
MWFRVMWTFKAKGSVLRFIPSEWSRLIIPDFFTIRDCLFKRFFRAEVFDGIHFRFPLIGDIATQSAGSLPADCIARSYLSSINSNAVLIFSKALRNSWQDDFLFVPKCHNAALISSIAISHMFSISFCIRSFADSDITFSPFSWRHCHDIGWIIASR